MKTEVSIEQKAKDLATEVGDSLSKFLKVIKRELKEIEFNGIEFTRMNVIFEIDANGMHEPLIHITIWTSATGYVTTDEARQDSRFFTYSGDKRRLESIFWLIEHWKLDLIRNHQKLLKSKTLF